MRAADQPVPLLEGVQAIALPDFASLPAAQSTVQAMRAAGIEPDGYTLPAAAAAQIASQAAESAKTENKPVVDKLVGTAFQTAIGQITFGQNHELTENFYQRLEWRGNTFVPVTTPSN